MRRANHGAPRFVISISSLLRCPPSNQIFQAGLNSENPGSLCSSVSARDQVDRHTKRREYIMVITDTFITVKHNTLLIILAINKIKILWIKICDLQHRHLYLLVF